MNTRRSRARFALALALGLALSPASAAGPEGSRQPDVRLPTLVWYPGHPGFPSDSPGAQGQVDVRMYFDARGALVRAEFTRSSRNRDLDRRALQYFNRHGAVPEGTALPATVDASIRFAIDSDASVVRKTCAEFNADFAYYGNDKQRREGPVGMRVFWLAMAAYTPPLGVSGDLAARMPRAASATVDTCAANPSANFFEVFTSHLDGSR